MRELPHHTSIVVVSLSGVEGGIVTYLSYRLGLIRPTKHSRRFLIDAGAIRSAIRFRPMLLTAAAVVVGAAVIRATGSILPGFCSRVLSG